MEWKTTIKTEQGLITIPKRWLHIHYYEAMNILFRFENSLRVFVYAVLKNEYFDKWKDCNFSVSGGDSNSINGIAARRINQADSFGYLGFDIKAPLMHLTSGELVELLTSDAYWPKFKQNFRGNKDIIKNKLLEIGTIRNSLAHFRPIKPEDIELVKQNSRHTLLGVEKCLSNIFNQSIRVPTNTSENWYKSISTLGTNYIKTAPFYSADEQWINVRLKFNTPTLSQRAYGDDYIIFTVTKINTPNILVHHDGLAKYLTYLSEEVNAPRLSEERKIILSKDINFVFHKDVLVENYEVIAEEFKEILRKITEECDLLEQDNLARGIIVETASASAWYNIEEENSRWNFSYSELSQPYQPNHPDEYWGQHQSVQDVVGSCKRYPWMPEDISQMEFPWE